MTGPAAPVNPDGSDDPGTDAAEIDDRLRRRVLWSIPTGLFVCGSRHGDERGLMTANLVVQVAVEPKLVAVAIEAESRTRHLVQAGGSFTLSMLDPKDKAVVRRFVKPVPADDVVISEGVAVSMRTEPVIEAVTGSPILSRAVAWLDCDVRHRMELGSHVLFVGEVVAVDGPGEGVPTVLSMADTRMNYGG